MNTNELLTKRYFTDRVCCQVAQQWNARQSLTVCIELIPRVNRKNVYDEKIQVQYKDGEVALLLDVLLMYRSEMAAKFHGPEQDKALTVRNQPNGLFVFGYQGSEQRQLNFVIEEENRYELLLLVAKVLAIRDGVTIRDVLDLSRSLAQRRAQFSRES